MLYVHRSERADHLLEVLAEILSGPLEDPLVTELVAVPTRGVERWLTQRLSHRLGCSPGRTDGVAANIDFPFPGSLVGHAVASATGLESADDPWAPERAVWPLLDVVDEHLGDLCLEPLAEHLRASSPTRDDRALTRFAAVRHIADLYDQYAVHRPRMITSWASGLDAELDERHRWQAALWRLLRERIGTASPAERLEEAITGITSDPSVVNLPPRVSLFGLTRLPASYLMILRALASSRDVHLLLLHPSGSLWDSVQQALPAPPEGLGRAEDPTADISKNPLLRSWGRDAREMQLVLAAQAVSAGDYRPVEEEGHPTLLRRIQAAIRLDQPPAGLPATDLPRAGGPEAVATRFAAGAPVAPDARPLLEEGDRSVQIHSCHGRYRQVEVLRDSILHLLSTDEALELRDIIVMCPDVETFAPLVQAVFAAEPPGPEGEPASPELRVRLADRSLRQTNPLLAVAAALLELAEGRLTASQVLDLAGRDPVRLRFRFDDDDLAKLERWVIDMGTRWGFDGDHRRLWKLGGLEANTWESGLDRLLLGVAMADDDYRLFDGTLPLDDVSSTDVDLAGRFTEYVTRLGEAMRLLAGRKPVESWIEDLVRSTETLARADPRETWQADQFRRVLDEVAAEAGAAEAPSGAGRRAADEARPDLTVPEVRSLLGNRLKGRPTRANFRTGDLTVCTLVPMRSVPHRVVCLLGLDDGVFPRHPGRDGDDIIAADPHVGDRDPRSEDRQLLLDAILAATDRLVITYSGRDERTNRTRPPSVPIAELLDTIDHTVRLPGGERARDVILVEHPLQSFDPRNFEAGALGISGPWGFSRVELRGAKAVAGPKYSARPFLASPLPAWDSSVVSLESLVGFVKSPVHWFLRERLGIYVNGSRDEVEDRLPLELSSLEEWGFGDRLLRALLDGADPAQALQVELARGLLPPAQLSEEVMQSVLPVVEQLAKQVQSLPCFESTPRSVEINLRLPGGRSLVGTVAGVRDSTVLTCLYSKLAPKHRLESWVRLLALAASQTVTTPSAVTIGRSGTRTAGRVALSQLRLDGADSADAEHAFELLVKVIDLYERGMREPLPIYCRTSLEWAEKSRRSDDSDKHARDAWEGDRFEGESSEEAHVVVLGGRAPFNTLFDAAPREDEQGPAWAESEKSRFGRLSRRLWDDVLDHESMKVVG